MLSRPEFIPLFRRYYLPFIEAFLDVEYRGLDCFLQRDRGDRGWPLPTSTGRSCFSPERKMTWLEGCSSGKVCTIIRKKKEREAFFRLLIVTAPNQALARRYTSWTRRADFDHFFLYFHRYGKPGPEGRQPRSGWQSFAIYPWHTTLHSTPGFLGSDLAHCI